MANVILECELQLTTDLVTFLKEAAREKLQSLYANVMSNNLRKTTSAPPPKPGKSALGTRLELCKSIYFAIETKTKKITVFLHIKD